MEHHSPGVVGHPEVHDVGVGRGDLQEPGDVHLGQVKGGHAGIEAGYLQQVVDQSVEPLQVGHQ